MRRLLLLTRALSIFAISMPVFLSASGASAASIFVVDSSLASPSVALGSAQTYSVSMRADASISRAQIQVSIMSLNGAIVHQRDYFNQDFAAGVTKVFNGSFSVPGTLPIGTYKLVAKASNTNWTASYGWWGGLGNFEVMGSTRAPASAPAPVPAATPAAAPVSTPAPAAAPAPVAAAITTSSSGFGAASVFPSSNQSAFAALVSTTNIAVAHVKLAVMDSKGGLAYQKDFFNQSLSADVAKRFEVSFVAPSSVGKYTLSVFVNNANWTNQLAWIGNAGSFAVASGVASSLPSPIPAPAPAPTPTPAPAIPREPASAKTRAGVSLPSGWVLKQSDFFGTSGNVANASQLFSRYYEGLWYNVEFATTVEGSSGRQIFPPRQGTYIDGEQQWYTHFDDARVFNFKSDRLTIQARGQTDGSILSGKIVSRWTSRSFCVEAKYTVPNVKFAFPAFWQFANSGHYGTNDASEIDVEQPITQDGSYTVNTVSILTHGARENILYKDSRVNQFNNFVDMNFFGTLPHTYTTCYDDSGSGTLTRYIDGQLIYKSQFKWNEGLGGTGRGVNASTILNLAVGSTKWIGLGQVINKSAFSADMDIYSVEYYAP